MQRPVRIKTMIGLTLFIMLLLFSMTQTVRAAETVTLIDMEKQESPETTRIIFHLSGPVQFDQQHSGQRVDLTLDEVQAAAELRRLPEDERLIKILLVQKSRRLLASVLLRRTPEQVTTQIKSQPDRIVIDIDWSTGDSARPAVAFSIAGMPTKKAGRRAEQYQRKSPWEDRWYEFYRQYRSDWKVNLPVNFTLPPLPPLISDQQSPLWPLQAYADQQKFLSLLQEASALTGLDSQQRDLRDLMIAEAQLRTDAVVAANARLHQLAPGRGSSALRVGYLTAYGTALADQPLVARLQLQQLLDQAAADEMEPFVRLLLAETDLSAGHDEAALKLLDEPSEPWPDVLDSRVDLRKADGLAGNGNLLEALELYRKLSTTAGLFENEPFSCQRAAQAAFKQQQYPFATELSYKLAEGLKGEVGEGLALFATGIAAYEAGDLGWGMINLQRAAIEQTKTEGGDRAALRLIDLTVIKTGESGLAQVVAQYKQLGDRSKYRPVREEALFKHALGLYLLKDHHQSVMELMEFRRNFSTSSLRREVDLLLLEQLPGVVHQLLESEDDLQAVVLVEQNRKLLLGRGFDQQFLYNLALAFEKIGLYDRAGRVLLYLYDRTAGQTDQQAVYLPLARSFLKRDEFSQAGDYAQRYLEKYPQGEDAGSLFAILLDSFEPQQRDAELLDWLNRKDRPRSLELESRAAWLYWKLGQVDAVIAGLEWVRDSGQKLEVKEMALLGEAYYQRERNQAAEKIYNSLHEDQIYASQARYRSAQLLIKRGERMAALNLLEQAVEKDPAGAWGKLARDLLLQEQR